MVARRRPILFGVGTYQAFFNGFASRIMSHDDRVEGGAQIAVINPDGSGFREITSGANNNGFPSMSPDGKRVVYRTFGPDGEGLRIMNIETRAVTTLTSGYDNFPIWSPRGDRIVFSRVADGDYEIYTIAPDGTRREAPDIARSATTRTRAGRPTASTSCLRAAGWDSRTKAPTPTRRSRTASSS